MTEQLPAGVISDDEHPVRNVADNALESETSDEVYRFAAELANLIVWTADANGQFLSISPRFSEITGLRPGEEQWAIHPEDVAMVLEGWNRATHAGEMHWVEFRMRVRDGSYRYFRARASPRRNEQREIIGWYGFTEDIHDRWTGHHDREEMEERYRLAFSATNDALYDLDVPARQIRWRATGKAFFGYSPQNEPTALKWWEEDPSGRP